MTNTHAETGERLFSTNQNGYQASYITSMPHQHGLSCHDYWQILIHIKGNIQLAVNDEVYHLTSDQLVIIPPYHMHGITEISSTDILQAFVSLSPDFLQFAGVRQINFEQILMEYTGSGRYCFPMTHHDADICRMLLKRISENSDVPSSWSRFSDISRLLPVLRLVIETMFNACTQEKTTGSESIMHNILVYINANYTEKLTLQSIARKFGISVSTLSHDFKEYTQRSVYGYILYRRIMSAKQRLYENTPLNEIAYECGFSDYSNFLRSFTKELGMSPSEYRKMLRNKIAE